MIFFIDKFLFLDKLFIFADEINNIIDMIVFAVIGVVFFICLSLLSGEGDKFDATKKNRDEEFNISNKNFFL